MKDDKKRGLAAMLIAEAPKKGGEEDEGPEGKDMAVEDIMSAIESKDAGALKEALTAFVELCY